MNFRRYRKLFVVLVSIWLVLVALGMIFSRSIQDKVIQILSRQADNYLLSEVHIRKNNIRFSVFRRFPQASLELRNVCVMLPAGFEKQNCIAPKNDTLLFAKKLFLQLDILSLFSDNYELEKIEIIDGYLQILTNAKGNSSLDIIRKDTTNNTRNFTANIKSVLVSEMTLFNTDINNNSIVQAYVKKGTVSGSFTPVNFAARIKSNGTIQHFEVKGQKIEPLQNYNLEVSLKRKSESYSIDKGVFSLGNIPFRVMGSVKTGGKPLIDLIFSAKDVSVRQIDKAVFSGLMGKNGFEPRGGSLDIQATIVGQSPGMPSIKASFRLINGKFLDKKYNLTLKDIFLEGNADNGRERTPASTTVRLDTFSFSTGRSYQQGKVKIQNLIEPTVSLSLTGEVDINDLQTIIAIPNIRLTKGKVTNKAIITGKINKGSGSNNQMLNSIEVKGNFKLEELSLHFLKYAIPVTTLNGYIDVIDKNTLRFSNLKATCANSDISFQGILENFLEKGKIPSFSGDIHSNVFVVDDFIQSGNSNKSAVVFPDSVIVTGTLGIQSFAYAKFNSSEFRSQIDYRKKTLTAIDIAMNGFEGSLKGELSLTQKNSGNIWLYTKGTLSHVNIKQLFIGCKNFAQDIIGAEHLEGYVSGDVIFSTEWTNTLDFIPASVTGQGILNLAKGSIKNYEPLLGLSDYINVEELKHIQFDNLNTTISVRNELVYLDQTHIASSAISFDGSGVHGFNNAYEYRLQLGLSDILWGKAKKKRTEITEFGYVVDDGVGHTTIPLIIKGKGTEFEVSYDKRAARNNFKQKLSQEKTLLKDLFRNDSLNLAPGENTEHGLQIETEEQQNQKLKKTGTNTYQKKSNDFILEWDDSADSD